MFEKSVDLSVDGVCAYHINKQVADDLRTMCLMCIHTSDDSKAQDYFSQLKDRLRKLNLYNLELLSNLCVQRLNRQIVREHDPAACNRIIPEEWRS